MRAFYETGTVRFSRQVTKASVVYRLNHWEYVLHLTNPDKWSAAAVFQATRVFSSSLNVKMAQRLVQKRILSRVMIDGLYFRKI